MTEELDTRFCIARVCEAAVAAEKRLKRESDTQQKSPRRSSAKPQAVTPVALSKSVHLLRQFCEALDRHSAYLDIDFSSLICSAQAEFAVGYVYDLLKTEGAKEVVKLARTIRLGDTLDDGRFVTSIGKVLETGLSFHRPADIAKYLSETLAVEIGEAIGYCRASAGRIANDKPHETEALPFGWAMWNCIVLVETLSRHLVLQAATEHPNIDRAAVARRAGECFDEVTARLSELHTDCSIDELPDVVVPVNVAWVSPSLKFRRILTLLRAMASVAKRETVKAEEERRSARRSLAEKEAKAERFAARADIDVSLERRIERTLSRLEDELDDRTFEMTQATAVLETATLCASRLSEVEIDFRLACY